jgi:hypothetical protein
MSSSNLAQIQQKSSPKIRALPTEYNGITYRSRLEARWSVFFDALNVGQCYEEEGYELPNGQFYLPDFFIPKWNTYLEVKHVASPDERTKCAVLSDATNTRVLLIEGFPCPGSYQIHSFRPGDNLTCLSVPACQFAMDRKEDGVVWLSGCDGECACAIDKCNCVDFKWPTTISPELEKAYDDARRFWTDYRSAK